MSVVGKFVAPAGSVVFAAPLHALPSWHKPDEKNGLYCFRTNKPENSPCLYFALPQTHLVIVLVKKFVLCKRQFVG